MSKIYPLVTLVLVIFIFVSFFMSWISIEQGGISKVAKFVSGKEMKTYFMKISAYQVPILANSAESKIMISIIKLFNPGIKDADRKSYLIWAVPCLAILIWILALVLGNNKWFNLVVAVLGIAIFAIASYKISTTNLDKLIMKVNIEQGVWYTLYGFLGIGVLAALRFALGLVKKKV